MNPRQSAEATPSRLTIDLGALAANWRALADRAPGAKTAAVVKADAYGIGIEPAVKALSGAGCSVFFVARLAEGVRARAVAPDAPIYVLDGLVPGTEPVFAAAGLSPVLGSMGEVEAYAAYVPSGPKPPSAIHIDTGMNRLGLSEAEARDLAARPNLLKAAAPGLVMSHLACSDVADNPKNRDQLTRFRALRALYPNIPASLANSAGVFLGPDYHFDLTRPGIALYGADFAAGRPPLRPVVTAEARILRLRMVEAGETIGYGAAQRLTRPTRVAILAIGYADGYHRLAGSADGRGGAHVYLRGARAPLIGRVSMDLAACDVTDVPGVEVGDLAELFGPNIPVDEVAGRANTIGYELLTGLGRRYDRRYLP